VAEGSAGAALACQTDARLVHRVVAMVAFVTLKKSEKSLSGERWKLT